ncbi:MAG: DedA family protein [Clostridia bacterium]|nr:DedA family protein [Clostridia bacterium]MDD4572414.1 DedA family protein [Clostridia bacterium]
MEQFTLFLDEIIHFDRYIPYIMESHGVLVYILLFLIIFCETGLVVTPFLPGDSIIFACGALAAGAGLNIYILIALFLVAAVSGDATNYFIGNKLGCKLIASQNRFVKPEYIHKAEVFYEKYGGKAIFLARFVPIVRTFAPFVAGLGNMHYPRFAKYNVVGAIVWVGIFLVLGYFFGNLRFIQQNFVLVTIAIIFISIMPMVIEIHRSKKCN